MKKSLIAIAFLLPTFAFAQTPQPQEYTIRLTAQEVDIVGRALGKLPYEDVALIIQKLRQQIVEQQSIAGQQPPKVEEK